ncbi:MAG: hypothetical protein H0T20_03810 [Actinobacteria bacterium]|nr:hypothetical protein [Actinomycetota bacterium]
MGKGLLIALLAAVVLGTAAVSVGARTPGAGGGTPAPAAFRLSDGSAGCAFDGTRLSCATASRLEGVVLEADGSSHPAARAVTWNETTPVLQRTESWWHGGFSCRVEGDLVCESESGSISVGAGGVGGAASSFTP